MGGRHVARRPLRLRRRGRLRDRDQRDQPADPPAHPPGGPPHVSSQTSTLSPSSESLRALAYNPARNELWGTCNGFVGFCVPYRIDVFDAATLTRQAVLTGPDAIWVGVHGAFTPSGSHYYQPLTNNRVLVIDTATRAVVGQIPVGQNPRGVYMQGNAAPKELK